MAADFPQRKSPRLQGYDYTQEGVYFVTLCTRERYHFFGKIKGGMLTLSDAGQIAAERWFVLPDHHPNIELDAFVVMPNHIHGIIIIVGTTQSEASQLYRQTDKACLVPTEKSRQRVLSGSLSAIIGSYKSSVTRQVRSNLNQPYLTLWQGRFHDHLIRNKDDLNRIREYVISNPARWEEDRFFTIDAS
jgi:putative transposase